MHLLLGKVAVITGATRGFGLATARAYAREGAFVMVCSRSSDSVKDAIRLLKASGAQVQGLICDVSQREGVQALADAAVDAFGRFDIWVNNAALSAPYGPTMLVEPETYERVTRTNILGVYYGSRAALKHFLSRPEGATGTRLINILGRGSRGPTPFQNAYAPSKAWVQSFTLALAKEYTGSGVGIFGYNPGMMTTELLETPSVIEGHQDRLKVLPMILRMWAKPPEVPAEKMVWLASSAMEEKSGKVYGFMNPGNMLTGALKEGMRRLSGRQPGGGMHPSVVQPAEDFPKSST